MPEHSSQVRNGLFGGHRSSSRSRSDGFSAWFEVYLQGHWYTFDARHNRRRIGRVLIGRGRDAADVPITMSFGKQTLEVFRVITEEIDLAAISDLSIKESTGRSQAEVAGARSYDNEHVL